MVSAKAPLTTPFKLRLPLPVTPMDDAEPSATVPLTDARFVLLLTSAPALPMPVPFKVRLLVMLLPMRSSAAPLLTDAPPVPSAAALFSCSMPTLTVVPPL